VEFANLPSPNDIMTKFVLIFFCCCSFTAIGQDLTGIWRGHFHSSGNRMIEQLFGEVDRYKFEIQLDQRSKLFQGVTYSYKTTVFYGKATCSGTVNPNTKKVRLEELKIVEVRMVGGSACIMTCYLQYSKSGDEEFLEGTYSSINTTDSTNCGKGTVFLRKVTTSDFHKEPFLVNREKAAAAKKPPVIAKTVPKTAPTTPTGTNPTKKTTTTSATTKPIKKPVTQPATSTAKKTTSTQKPVTQKPAVKNTPSLAGTRNPTVKVVPLDSSEKVERKPTVIPRVLLTRQNELVKTISTAANEITINLYDNGTIDNDTVSVYLDKKLVVTKQRLTGKPITIKFPLNEDNTSHELVMVAENLGEIPPNTSLMVVTAGNQQYEVRITSNEQKNAVVIFKYEKSQ
jgi:hypothetical protein